MSIPAVTSNGPTTASLSNRPSQAPRARLQAGGATTRHLQAIALMALAGLLVHLSGGQVETHLTFFIGMTLLLGHRDPTPLVTAGLLATLMHWVIYSLQVEGLPVYLFTVDTLSVSTLLSHSAALLGFTAVLVVLAQRFRTEKEAAQEATALLQRLQEPQGANFRHRAQPHANGEVSNLGQIFNDYADQISLVVSTFNMLALDIRELSAVTDKLGENSHLRFEEVENAAADMKQFIQQLGKQSEQVQSTATESVKFKEDCFDLVNAMNQSLEQVRRMSKQTFEANRDIQALAADQSVPLAGETRNRLMVVAASLDHLAERTQIFLSKIEVIQQGLSALENQSLQIDHAIHQWLEVGHSNQRRGWEVLGVMEHLQANAQEAFSVLHNTVSTITRADRTTKDIEQRLNRFDL